MKKFKTLQFKDEKEQTLGTYAVIIGDDFGGCETPQLMTNETTMELLKKAYPKNDFSTIDLITIGVEYLFKNGKRESCKVCKNEFSDLDMQMESSRPKDVCVTCFTSNA